MEFVGSRYPGEPPKQPGGQPQGVFLVGVCLEHAHDLVVALACRGIEAVCEKLGVTETWSQALPVWDVPNSADPVNGRRPQAATRRFR
jgi:hypothetical protein